MFLPHQATQTATVVVGLQPRWNPAAHLWSRLARVLSPLTPQINDFQKYTNRPPKGIEVRAFHYDFDFFDNLNFGCMEIVDVVI